MQILRPKREKEMSRDTPDRRNMLQLLMNPGLLVVAIFLRPMTEETERQKKNFRIQVQLRRQRDSIGD